jgi:hypothetical protein
MVDALRRAHHVVTTDGIVVDLHPTAASASMEVGAQTIGHVDAGDAPLRHAAAETALKTVVDAGLFDVDAVVGFDFYTYGDTVEELRDYIVENWRSARIDPAILDAARRALGAAPAGFRPRVLERVSLTILRPVGGLLARTRPQVVP